MLEKNLAAYQALADDYQARSPERLRDSQDWLAADSTPPAPEVIGRALDIGCADGTHAHFLVRQGYEVTAVDFSPRMLELARAPRARPPGGRGPLFLEGEFLYGPFRDAAGRDVPIGGPFDLVLASAFVHLFPKQVAIAVVRKALDLVDLGGRALFSTTIEESLQEGYFGKVGSDGTSVDRWRRHYPKDEFIALIRDVADRAFVVSHQLTSDSSGRAWLTVCAQRKVPGSTGDSGAS